MTDTPATNGTSPRELTAHDLYELCVQSPSHLVPFLRAVHGRDPRVLGEDFAGTAALSHLWADRDGHARAFAVDLDSEALAFRGEHPRVTKRNADVCAATDPADVIFVGNFSIGYRHTRNDLVAYLAHARSRLNEGGVFVCDTYGGESAATTGSPTTPATPGTPASASATPGNSVPPTPPPGASPMCCTSASRRRA
jgi:hypothetical protein